MHHCHMHGLRRKGQGYSKSSPTKMATPWTSNASSPVMGRPNSHDQTMDLWSKVGLIFGKPEKCPMSAQDCRSAVLLVPRPATSNFFAYPVNRLR